MKSVLRDNRILTVLVSDGIHFPLGAVKATANGFAAASSGHPSSVNTPSLPDPSPRDTAAAVPARPGFLDPRLHNLQYPNQPNQQAVFTQTGSVGTLLRQIEAEEEERPIGAPELSEPAQDDEMDLGAGEEGEDEEEEEEEQQDNNKAGGYTKRKRRNPVNESVYVRGEQSPGTFTAYWCERINFLCLL